MNKTLKHQKDSGRILLDHYFHKLSLTFDLLQLKVVEVIRLFFSFVWYFPPKKLHCNKKNLNKRFSKKNLFHKPENEIWFNKILPLFIFLNKNLLAAQK